ncbi:hypothetical protein PR003_g30034 [Phytophthora rubi]|uniref:DDE-1 domain-containing protein n=1 Tax=Phytophthora rubi TaxID=129364 RepID=A0A6A3GV52_9STRA|nr:hypothetical protein PR001_g30227 [Phytophthora rubi]KAE9273002.1 hypothetical protein PR003_g30034 [Phytophthora rubi]
MSVVEEEPRGTLTTDKKEKGKKQSKVRVTVCVGTNSDGSEKLPLHFVGKAKKPRPFKNHNVFEETRATYTNTPKAWMNTAKFCEWLSDLNEAMRLQQRYVFLLVDNVSSHDEAGEHLSNVRLEKLPLNTTRAAAHGPGHHQEPERPLPDHQDGCTPE